MKRLVMRIIDGETIVTHIPVDNSTHIRPTDANELKIRGYSYFAAKNRLARRRKRKTANTIPTGKSYDKIIAKVTKSSGKTQ